MKIPQEIFLLSKNDIFYKKTSEIKVPRVVKWTQNPIVLFAKLRSPLQNQIVLFAKVAKIANFHFSNFLMNKSTGILAK